MAIINKAFEVIACREELQYDANKTLPNSSLFFVYFEEKILLNFRFNGFFRALFFISSNFEINFDRARTFCDYAIG